MLGSSSCGLYTRTDGGTRLTPLEKSLFGAPSFMAPAPPNRCTFSLDRSVTVRHETERFVGGPDALITGLGEPGDMREKLVADRAVLHGGKELAKPGIRLDGCRIG